MEHKKFLDKNLSPKLLQNQRIFYIINSKIFPAPGAYEDSVEVGNNSRCWFGELIEAEACLCAYGAICRHSDLGGGTSGGDHKVVAHKVDLMTFLSGYLGVDLYVVSIVHLLLDVLIHLGGNFRFWVDLVVERLNSLVVPKKFSPKLASFSVYK